MTDLLWRIADALADGRSPRTADARAFVAAVHAAEIVDVRQGREKPIADRDAALRDAAKFFAGLSIRDQARSMSRALARYRDTAWRRDKAGAGPKAGTVEEAWFRILSIRDLPLGDDRIRQLLDPVDNEGSGDR